MIKSLDTKLANIAADPASGDFILADAKDPDLAFGLAAPGTISGGPSPRYRSLSQFREIIREIVRRELVDIMLMSASTSEILTIRERMFDNSSVTAAVRANDTTDIWSAQGSQYNGQASIPFSSTTIDHIQSGVFQGSAEQRQRGADLALYSVTFNNDAQLDLATAQAYKAFRIEAEQKGLRHFLEIFAPNALARPVPDVGRFVNDSICRLLGGVTSVGRPLFLKMPYFGPAALESLVYYDPSLIVGILGGAAGTTHDAFALLANAKKYGARVALFGRKINQAEDQISFLEHMRAVADGLIQPDEAVRSYHGQLQQRGIPTHRSLEADLLLTQ